MSDSYDPIDTGSQTRAQADEELRKQLAKDVEDKDFLWLMNDARGRRIVWRQLERAGVFRLSYEPGIAALDMAAREGSRKEGLRILAQINALCPDKYFEMVREHNDDSSAGNH